MVAVGRQAGLHGLDHGGEELVGNIRYDKAHGLFLAGAEAAGGGVRRIAQLRDGLVHLFLGLAGNITGIVDGVGHRGGGNARQLGHITDRHFHRLFLLRNRFSHYVIYFFFQYKALCLIRQALFPIFPRIFVQKYVFLIKNYNSKPGLLFEMTVAKKFPV